MFGRADPLLRQLIIRAGYAPMILQRAFYDKHSAFARPASGRLAVAGKVQSCARRRIFRRARSRRSGTRPKGPLFNVVFKNPDEGSFSQRFFAVVFFAPLFILAAMIAGAAGGGLSAALSRCRKASREVLVLGAFAVAGVHCRHCRVLHGRNRPSGRGWKSRLILAKISFTCSAKSG